MVTALFPVFLTVVSLSDSLDCYYSVVFLFFLTVFDVLLL